MFKLNKFSSISFTVENVFAGTKFHFLLQFYRLCYHHRLWLASFLIVIIIVFIWACFNCCLNKTLKTSTRMNESQSGRLFSSCFKCTVFYDCCCHVAVDDLIKFSWQLTRLILINKQLFFTLCVKMCWKLFLNIVWCPESALPTCMCDEAWNYLQKSFFLNLFKVYGEMFCACLTPLAGRILWRWCGAVIAKKEKTSTNWLNNEWFIFESVNSKTIFKCIFRFWNSIYAKKDNMKHSSGAFLHQTKWFPTKWTMNTITEEICTSHGKRWIKINNFSFEKYFLISKTKGIF